MLKQHLPGQRGQWGGIAQNNRCFGYCELVRSGEICPAITENGAGSISGSSAGAEKVFGKSSRYIIQHILDNPGQPFDVAPFIDRRCKHPAPEIQAAVDGAVSYEQAAKLKECLLHIDQLSEHREHIETELLWLAEPYPHPAGTGPHG